jgi:clan AA aspartic protease
MIVGSVEANGDAVVSLPVRGIHGRVIDVRAAVDTGFNGCLTLSQAEIASLGLSHWDTIRCVLADGSDTISRVFTTEIHWLGQWRRAFIIEAEGGPLLGMELLRGTFLGIEVTAGGRVEIRPLTR